ncbi:hypothetical protein [Dapis sp. BLCC M229]|uniref:hypothetical protein n=1 Tax=Dapis sp. BLCC M229 TaxID=3400188 RepID=UPI003CF4300C
MEVINDRNPKDKIYISHHPKIKNSIAFLPNAQKYASLQSIIVDSFIPRKKHISFEKDCDRRDSKPNNKIVIYGLNESRIREFYQKYLQNDLSEEKTKDHFLKNNCCTVVAYFICKGLDCFKKTLSFVHLQRIKLTHFLHTTLILRNWFWHLITNFGRPNL